MNDRHFVAVWGNGMSCVDAKPENYAKNITLRYPVYMPFDATAVRLTLDNSTGLEDVTITRASIMVGDTFVPVTVNGGEAIAILAGGQTVTDAVDVNVAAGDMTQVSLYLGDFTNMRASVTCTGPLSDGAKYYTGDQTNVAVPDPAQTMPIGRCWFLSCVSVLTAKENRAIVCYGDSITTQAWPDELQLRMKRLGYTHTGIVRKAIGGSRVLRAYDCLQYQNYGQKSLDRFEKEINVDAVDTVIIFQGINDIIHPVGADVNIFRPWSDLPTAEELAEGYRKLIAIAREKGLKVYLATLMPFCGWSTYAPFREELRRQVNEFIRTTDLIDGYIDFDAAVREEGTPDGCRAGMLSADHLHPAADGHRAMAEAVPEALLR